MTQPMWSTLGQFGEEYTEDDWVQAEVYAESNQGGSCDFCSEHKRLSEGTSVKVSGRLLWVCSSFCLNEILK